MSILESNISNAITATSNTYTTCSSTNAATTATINYNGNYVTTTGIDYIYNTNW